ncbi:MAG: coproporphyrinogen dehydrogenase HemZ [Lachnospiraceae bacterium]|jgi:oxygen-independent coproporphyrinogen-3 oxidase|nr:coproporphyrinogen dehydrogenase HemZ [Lachnospiraceae bacterium]
MIAIQLNTDEFEYDIRSLVKAFYPDKEQYVHCDVSKVVQQKPPLKQPDRTLCVVMNPQDMHAYFLGEEENAVVVSTVAEDRTQRKNDVKRLLYTLLSRKTGMILPWGSLTGIRPTKLFTRALEEGRSDYEIMQQMKDSYLISEAKAKMGLAIAHKERELLSRLPEKDGYSLYIHIPFCPTTCLYCSFTSFPAKAYAEKMDAYVAALKRELTMYAEYLKNKELTTIYVGGGTPTTLSEQQFDDLFLHLQQSFDTSRVREFTVEAGRPDSITPEKLKVLRRHGVTRISINPQTMNDETLKVLGRRHTVAQTKDAFAMARDCGFDNINMDIILGLPNEGEEEVRTTLQEIEKLHPDSLTAHSLAIKHNSRLNLMKEQYSDLKYADAVFGMELAGESAAKMGMDPYYLYRQKQIAGNQENIGYAVPGKEGLYNILIMEERQSIFSIGAGAVTKVVKTPGQLYERIETVKDVNLYLARLEEMMHKKQDALVRAGLNV